MNPSVALSGNETPASEVNWQCCAYRLLYCSTMVGYGTSEVRLPVFANLALILLVCFLSCIVLLLFL